MRIGAKDSNSPGTARARRESRATKRIADRGARWHKQDVNEMAVEPETRFRIILKRLRERSGVSGAKCATALGFNHPSGYLRYENSPAYDAKPIPLRIIRTLVPLLVGGGIPPVAESELIAISDMPDFYSPMAPTGVEPPKPAPRATSIPQATATYAVMPPEIDTSEPGAGVPVRYRINPGIYTEPDAILPARGRLPLLADTRYDANSQWGVVMELQIVLGDRSLRLGDRLLCVDLEEWVRVRGASPPVGAVAVVRVDRAGLVSFRLGDIVSHAQAGHTILGVALSAISDMI